MGGGVESKFSVKLSPKLNNNSNICSAVVLVRNRHLKEVNLVSGIRFCNECNFRAEIR